MLLTKQKIKKNLQKGLSLIEASMVLALSAIVISGVMYYYQSASDNNKTQNTVSEIMSLVSTINGLYVGQSSYSGLNSAVIYNTSAVPDNYKANDSIYHPFNDQIIIGSRGSSGTDGYYLVLKNIPQAACVQLSIMNFGTSMAGIGVGDDMESSAQNSTPTQLDSNTITSRNTYYDTAFTPVQASNVCTQTENDIAFLLK